MILIISFNIYTKSNNNINLFNENKLYNEIYKINTCCADNKPINCSRQYTYFNKNIKKQLTNANKKKYYRFNKTTFIRSFSIQKSKILIALHSHISLFYHRYVFRSIYKNYKNIQLLFFIGLDKNKTYNYELYKEMKIYKDIVLFNFYCDYYKLCLLTYNFLLWVKEYQNNYDIIIKQDTDTFLNILLAESILFRIIKLNKSFVIGNIWYFNNNNKKYPSGMSYIFLSKSIDYLVNNIDIKINKIKCSFEEDMLFGYLARESNFTFFDCYKSFNYTSYKHVPKFNFNIATTFMIHTLRIAEIAFLHLIINNQYSKSFYLLNKTCNLHN